ncbi:MAG: hypothetical protein COY80_05220 [Candidatus Pacebacteria bacterium CG_4_10_14_0_8_um_filter_42_14]|nr:MAG: hypothetical protein COY80_05220 [Candidatus Pacebacteria bacterium CG_4_10_14_0_8_um_filter_42_14]
MNLLTNKSQLTRSTLAAFCLAALVAGGVAFAQDQASETIFLKRFKTEESQRLIGLYQANFEKYKTSERDFYLAKAQYQQINTLASLESAVVSTRQVMVDRADVLIVYEELLAASLVDSTGAELSMKQDTLAELQSQIGELKAHKEVILAAQDRAAVYRAGIDFSLLVPELSATAYETLSQIVIADVQRVYDKTVTYYADLKKAQAEIEISPLKAEERKRAYGETDALMASIGDNLDLIRGSVTAKNQRVDHSSYTEIARSLSSAHAQLSQAMDFLNELERGGRSEI